MVIGTKLHRLSTRHLRHVMAIAEWPDRRALADLLATSDCPDLLVAILGRVIAVEINAKRALQDWLVQRLLAREGSLAGMDLDFPDAGASAEVHPPWRGEKS